MIQVEHFKWIHINRFRKQRCTQIQGTWKHKQKDIQERGEEKAKVFENRFRSGGKENKRRMANNVMQGRRVYDGYLVWLDLA